MPATVSRRVALLVSLSFTVDTAACERNGGANTSGGMSMVSIRAQDAAMDATVQHITVEFE